MPYSRAIRTGWLCSSPASVTIAAACSKRGRGRRRCPGRLRAPRRGHRSNPRRGGDLLRASRPGESEAPQGRMRRLPMQSRAGLRTRGSRRCTMSQVSVPRCHSTPEEVLGQLARKSGRRGGRPAERCAFCQSSSSGWCSCACRRRNCLVRPPPMTMGSPSPNVASIRTSA